MSSVFTLEYGLCLADITQPLLKPSLLWPVPILPGEPISVIRAAVYFALKKNELPVAHDHFLLPQYAKGKECASFAKLTETRKWISLKAARIRWVARHKTIVSKYRRMSKYR